MASNYVRNGLKIGLLLQESIGANPYKKGFIAATDNHVARPGKTDEKGHFGEWGYEDSRPYLRLTPFALLNKEEVNNSSMPFDGFGVNPVVWPRSRPGIIPVMRFLPRWSSAEPTRHPEPGFGSMYMVDGVSVRIRTRSAI